MKKQKIVKAYVDLSHVESAYDRIIEAAGSGNWRVLSLAPMEGLTESYQDGLGGGEFEEAEDNPVVVLALVEEA